MTFLGDLEPFLITPSAVRRARVPSIAPNIECPTSCVHFQGFQVNYLQQHLIHRVPASKSPFFFNGTLIRPSLDYVVLRRHWNQTFKPGSHVRKPSLFSTDRGPSSQYVILMLSFDRFVLLLCGTQLPKPHTAMATFVLRGHFDYAYPDYVTPSRTEFERAASFAYNFTSCASNIHVAP